MSTPVLVFTPAMFAAARRPIEAERKTVTRRLIAGAFASAFAKLEISTLAGRRVQWLGTCHTGTQVSFGRPSHLPGEVKPMATTWAVSRYWDDHKPTSLPPAEVAECGGIWFDDGSPKPAWAGKNRPARFLSRQLYALAPQVQIVSVRAEPVQSLTEEEAIREGICSFQGMYFHHRPTAPQEQHFMQATMAFADLWESLHGPGAWQRNHYVQRIEFKLV